MGNKNGIVPIPEQNPVAADLQSEISFLPCHRPDIPFRRLFTKSGQGGFYAAQGGFRQAVKILPGDVMYVHFHLSRNISNRQHFVNSIG
jgi:hypothetical protein